MSIIGLDLDGTATAYNRGIACSIAREHGIEIDSPEFVQHFPAEHPYNFDNWTHITDFSVFKDYHARAVENGIYRDLEVFKGAEEALWKLSEEGHHIRVITSRFVKGGQHAKVVADTAYWLDKNNIPYKDIMFTARKTDVFADVYIDDAPSNLFSFQKADRPYIIFDAFYNRDIEGPRVDNWDDAYYAIRNIVG